MTQIREPISGIYHGYDEGEDGWAVGMEANLVFIGATLQISVKDKDLTGPPASPSPGDRYLVATSGTGNWSGKDGHLAVYRSTTTSWEFYAPVIGWSCYVEDEDAHYTYKSGGWAINSSGSGDFMADGSVSMTGDLDLGGNKILQYAEPIGTPSSTSGAITLDLSTANIFNITLTENITSLTFSGVPSVGGVNIVLKLTQNGTGGWTITWPVSVKWGGGTVPTLSTAANATDVLALLTLDAGTTWYGFQSGIGMA